MTRPTALIEQLNQHHPSASSLTVFEALEIKEYIIKLEDHCIAQNRQILNLLTNVADLKGRFVFAIQQSDGDKAELVRQIVILQGGGKQGKKTRAYRRGKYKKRAEK